MVKQIKDKRGFLRVDDAISIKYNISSFLHEGVAVDIGGGGIRIETDEDIPVGAKINLKLSLPTKEEEIEAEGCVVWREEKKTRGEIKYLLGVYFSNITEQDREKVIHYVFLKHYGLRKEEGAAINVEGLTKKYGSLFAVKSVNLKINKGEIFALLGPNGAGKTTLTRILSTLLVPTSGEVKILGYDLLKEKDKIRKQIGYMPQSPVLYDDLTARENLVTFARAYQIPDEEIPDRVEDALQFCELQKRGDSLFRTYSGGMKQRLSLAVALIHRPKILFLDEPTAGVDLRLRLNFWQHFHELAQTGVTVFVTTHQMDEVEWCTRVAFMQSGKIIVDDTPKNVKRLGKTKIFLFFGGEKKCFEAKNYEEELPQILKNNISDIENLDRIEIQESSFEEVIRDLIKDEEMRD